MKAWKAAGCDALLSKT